MKILAVTAAVALLALGGCDAGTDSNNSGVTAEEAAALNETENMLDIEDIPASEDMSLGNEVPMDDLGADTGELPVTDEAATNAE